MHNMLNLASKDLMSEFLCVSVGRVLSKDLWGKCCVPQCVSVYNYHKDTDSFEYMFTKDDRVDFERDPDAIVIDQLFNYADTRESGIVFYMHTAGVKIVSKHMGHPY